MQSKLKTAPTESGDEQVGAWPREHWKAQQEQRLALGVGKSPADALVFGNYDGAPLKPDQLSGQFARTMEATGLPHVTLHTLRHTHASQLIAAGIDAA